MTYSATARTLAMNAVACLFLIHTLLLLRWRGSGPLRCWLERTEAIVRAIEARSYELDGIDGDHLAAVFQRTLQAGQLNPKALRSLLTWIRRLEQDDQERLRIGHSSAIRLGLAACLGLLTSLVLEGNWFLRFTDNPGALLLLLGDGLFLILWLKCLKAHPLTDSAELQADFTAAWLGQSQGGPWHEAWLQLKERGRFTGRDVTDAMGQLLEDWLLDGTREQEKCLIWSEELFGLVELAGSVYFLGTACALPLLRFWGS